MKTSMASILNVCAVCNQTGQFGAKWNFFVGDSKTPQRVHKPCGEMLQKSAPDGVRTALVPSPQLREEWRTQRLAKGFWNKAFGDAKLIKVKPTQVVTPQSAPATVAQAA